MEDETVQHQAFLAPTRDPIRSHTAPSVSRDCCRNVTTALKKSQAFKPAGKGLSQMRMRGSFYFPTVVLVKPTMPLRAPPDVGVCSGASDCRREWREKKRKYMGK